jgi:hypothetical protein
MRPNCPPPITPKVSGSAEKEEDEDAVAALPPGNKHTEWVMPFTHHPPAASSWLAPQPFDLF